MKFGPFEVIELNCLDCGEPIDQGRFERHFGSVPAIMYPNGSKGHYRCGCATGGRSEAHIVLPSDFIKESA